MSDMIFCPTCGAKICETAKSKQLKVKCRKCKSDLLIDKDESELMVKVVDKDIIAAEICST